ncbi:Sec-independent protein translocase subunit TatA [Pseudonocardia sp.]|jgi:sec-independent protein translocase protein TatA|uniref:Sec-independent protein translocase subunit TatA n=1 Tax=Pseudonocardia sp. TaxID=60912 RepID=UPI0031FC66E0
MPNLGGWEIVILVGVLLLLFGAKRLPTMARSVGQSARIFKGEMKGLRDEPTAAAPAPEREYTPTAVLPAVAEAPRTP